MSDEFVLEEELTDDVKMPWLTNKVYDFIKSLALVILPAVGALYFAIASLWGLPYAEQIVGTIVAVDTFLGVFLRYAARQYEASGAQYDGDIVVARDESGELTGYSLQFNGDPEALAGSNEVRFKVVNNS